jgi:hypothetical protein
LVMGFHVIESSFGFCTNFPYAFLRIIASIYFLNNI